MFLRYMELLPKLGHKRGKKNLTKVQVVSLLPPIYHSFIQVKVILFPDLVLRIKWTNFPPHLIHKGVILLIVCSHDNSVCFLSDIHFYLLSHRKILPRSTSSDLSSHSLAVIVTVTNL